MISRIYQAFAWQKRKFNSCRRESLVLFFLIANSRIENLSEESNSEKQHVKSLVFLSLFCSLLCVCVFDYVSCIEEERAKKKATERKRGRKKFSCRIFYAFAILVLFTNEQLKTRCALSFVCLYVCWWVCVEWFLFLIYIFSTKLLSKSIDLSRFT